MPGTYAKYSPAGGGGGTVTSVGLTAPAFLTVSGSPVIGSGTLALSLATEPANTVFAGPTSGAAAAPTFRALVTADLGVSMMPTFVSVTSPLLTLGTGITVAASGSDLTLTTATKTWTFSDSVGLFSDAGGISINGNLTFNTDNADDIGDAASQHRPRTMYIAGNINIENSTAQVGFGSHSAPQHVIVKSGSDLQVNLSGGGAFSFGAASPNAQFHTPSVVLTGSSGAGLNGAFIAWNNDGGGDIGTNGGFRPNFGYFKAGVGVNTTSLSAAALLQADSTTQGFLPPRMTTTQKNAISSPPAGLVVYDSTLNKLAVFTGSVWETVTSS